MYKKTTETVTKIAFLIGVRDDLFRDQYESENSELAAELFNNKSACIIRYLSKIRTSLMLNFSKINHEIMYELKNLNSLDWFDQNEIKQLEKWDIRIIKANHRAESYLTDISTLINKYIDDCANLFFDWQRWDYIRALFFIPKCSQPAVMKKETVKYQTNIPLYPFQMYIHWKVRDCGNLILNDKHFLTNLFDMHGQTFNATDYTFDASESTKLSIYDFINSGTKTVIAVDCENSDVYKLASVIRNLKKEELAKVSKILLFDDEHTSVGWDWLSEYTKIPVEQIVAQRVKEQKSQVDITLSVRLCKECYQNGVSSFIIFSSDCDYWALISGLKDADFLVMYEDSKCGQATKRILMDNGYTYCCIDDFCSGNTEDFTRMVLLATVKENLPVLEEYNLTQLLKDAFIKARIEFNQQSFNKFFTKYIKTLKIQVSPSGEMSWVFPS